MLMKRFITIILLFLSLEVMAQLEVKPGSFKEVEGFVNINTEIQTDDNDVPYAVIKVKTENINDKQRRELLFQGNAATFIECEYKVGEVWVYLTYKATYLKISHPDLSSTEFWFPFDMEPKKGYELTLVNLANMTDEEIVERMKRLEEALQNQQEQQIVSVEKPIEPTNKVSTTPKKPFYTFVTLNGSVNTYSQPAFGFTVGTMRKVGVFVTFMTNAVFTELGNKSHWEHMTAANIQTLLDDNPTYTFKRSYVSMSVIGGIVFKVYGPIDMRIGGGYSNNSLLLKVYDINDTSTNYCVSDYSSYGFGGLVGLQAYFGNFIVSLDGATTNFSIFEGRIGIGYGIGGK